MGWATSYIERLTRGETASFGPRGNSMSGKIDSGQLVTVEPVEGKTIKVGAIVLCKVNGVQYLHLVNSTSGDRFQIRNNHGRINGWTSRRNIFGIVTKIEN